MYNLLLGQNVAKISVYAGLFCSYFLFVPTYLLHAPFWFQPYLAYGKLQLLFSPFLVGLFLIVISTEFDPCVDFQMLLI